jgi:hypothetical protein
MARPKVPTLSYEKGEASIRLFVDNPPVATEAEATFRNYIDRRKSPGTPWLTRHEEEIEPNGSWEDFEVASGETYQYRARAVNPDGQTLGPILDAVAPELVGMWVHMTRQAALSIRQYLHLFETRKEERSVVVEPLRFIGRQRRVFESGDFVDLDLPLSIEVPFGPTHDEDVDWWREALRYRQAIVYRDSRGRMIYAFVGPEMTISDERAGTKIVTKLMESEYVEGVFQADD